MSEESADQGRQGASASKNRQAPVDELDHAILGVLTRDARTTNARVAERVGVAPSTALSRMRALRDSGVIKGFHADVDLAPLGWPLQVLIAIRLAVQAREQIDTFIDTVQSLPGVLMCFHLTGATDYLIWAAATDSHQLREFIIEHLTTHPAVAHAETSLIYEYRRGPSVWG